MSLLTHTRRAALLAHMRRAALLTHTRRAALLCSEGDSHAFVPSVTGRCHVLTPAIPDLAELSLCPHDNSTRSRLVEPPASDIGGMSRSFDRRVAHGVEALLIRRDHARDTGRQPGIRDQRPLCGRSLAVAR